MVADWSHLAPVCVRGTATRRAGGAGVMKAIKGNILAIPPLATTVVFWQQCVDQNEMLEVSGLREWLALFKGMVHPSASTSYIL